MFGKKSEESKASEAQIPCKECRGKGVAYWVGEDKMRCSVCEGTGVVDSEWEKAEDEKAERKEMTFWHTEPDHQHRGGVQPFTEAEMGKMEEQKEEERMARIMEEAEMGKRHEIEAEIRIALIKEEAEREKMKKDLE